MGLVLSWRLKLPLSQENVKQRLEKGAAHLLNTYCMPVTLLVSFHNIHLNLTSLKDRHEYPHFTIETIGSGL